MLHKKQELLTRKLEQPGGILVENTRNGEEQFTDKSKKPSKTENVSIHISDQRPTSGMRKDKSPMSVVSRFSGNISAGAGTHSVHRLSSKFLIRKPQTQANSNIGTPNKLYKKPSTKNQINPAVNSKHTFVTSSIQNVKPIVSLKLRDANKKGNQSTINSRKGSLNSNRQ